MSSEPAAITAPPTPRFSLIVPTYQRPHLLERALVSAQAQTLGDFELLVLDDGDDSATRELVARRSGDDPRLCYLAHGVRQGVAAARNTAIARATGEWVVFLDDDDEFRPTLLARVAERVDAAPEPLGFLWCGIRMVRDSDNGEVLVLERRWGAHLEALDPRPADRARRELDAIRIGCGFGLCVRRDLLLEVGGFDPALVVAEETDLVLRLLAHGARFAAIAEPLVVVHRVAGGSLSNTTPAADRIASVTRLVERNRWLLARRPRLAVKMGETLGREHLRAGDRRGAWRVALRLLRRYPLHRPSWRMLLRALGTRRPV